MKIPILCDTHFGFKNDAPLFREYFKRFFKEIFFPYIDQHNLKTIVHLGDLMDRRKYANIETLKYVRENFVQPLVDRDVTLHVMLGNHDVYYKNTNNVNSIRELYANVDNVKIYETFQDVQIGDMQFGVIPWICSDNHDQFLQWLKTSTSAVAVGHLELQGYEVLRGIRSEEGLSSNLFEKFELVYSGHFHQKNDDGHIYYLGTHYDMTFADVDERKGFHVFDTGNRTVEFVHNPHKLFYKLTYDDTDEVNIPDFSPYKNCYVKLIVRNKRLPKTFDKYIGMLYDAAPHEVSIIEEYELTETSNDDVDITQDTLSIIYNDIDDNKGYEKTQANSLKKIMTDLYMESFEVD